MRDLRLRTEVPIIVVSAVTTEEDKVALVNKGHYLRIYMAGIRRKLEPDPGHPRYFVTSPGLGLMFLADGARSLAKSGSED